MRWVVGEPGNILAIYESRVSIDTEFEADLDGDLLALEKL